MQKITSLNSKLFYCFKFQKYMHAVCHTVIIRYATKVINIDTNVLYMNSWLKKFNWIYNKDVSPFIQVASLVVKSLG